MNNHQLQFFEDGTNKCLTKDDFILFLKALKNDFLLNKKEWANITVDTFLDAIIRWCQDMPGYRVGDPFDKNKDFIEDMKNHINKVNEVFQANQMKRKSGLEHYLQNSPPWVIVSDLFLAGKTYE